MSEKMKGVIFAGDGNVELREFDIPEPGPDEVRVKIISTGICGSDLHLLNGPKEDMISGRFGSTGAGSPGYLYGVPAGHEGAGIVDKIGSNVKNVKLGDRVSIHHQLGCGICTQCISGEDALCQHRVSLGFGRPGVYANYIVVPSKACAELPENISMDVGAFIGCQIITAYSGLRKLNVSGNTPLVVYGLGPLGMVAALLAKHMGATVIGIDISDYRLNFAKEKNIVDYVINSKTEDPGQRLAELTKGKGVRTGIVACGADQMLWLSSTAAAIHGEISLIGASDNCLDPRGSAPFSFDSRHVLRKELVIKGSYVMPYGMMEELMDFLVEKNVNLDILVSHHFQPEDAQTAFDISRAGESGKVIISFD